MSKTLSRLALAAVAVLLMGSCAQINERLDKLESKIGDIENETIKSIEGQINAINSSIADLGTIRNSIQSLTQTVGSQGEDITALQSADVALGGRIDELKSYVNGELVNYAKSEWVEATFLTLEEYEKTCDTIAMIDAKIGDLDTRLSVEIAAIVDSLNWINAQFGSYYTAAQMDAKLDVLQEAIDSAKAENKAQADSIAAELTETKAAVDSAKANIRAEYRAAIDTAITALDGKLSKALQESIVAVNNEIDHLTGWVKAIDSAVYVLMGRVDNLEKMIQTVSIVPAYIDGSVEAKNGFLYLDVIVAPATAVKGLTKDNVKIFVNEAKTKAVSIDTAALTAFDVDVNKGIIIARADISSKLPVASGNALAVAVNVKNGISNHITDFYPVKLSSDVVDDVDTVWVSIVADEDFPESYFGNIINVSEGFKEEKVTSITMEGIGTIIFDETSTSKIKDNAQEAGATNVLFKVEDVTTTTKPVQDADVVLEVTMKTFGENGIEVFDKDNAAGEVTIKIPVNNANVVNVSSVTLVNDAGEPLGDGVVDGSIEFDSENRILTFKVKHFSKYAIDYEIYAPVTSVKLDTTSVELPVGDSITLVATVSPDDATNKTVKWSSDNSGVATVDNDGKVKAIASGNATITVTTNDGNKTASCSVTVKPISVTSVKLDTTSVKLPVGDSIVLVATVSPDDATDKTVTWSSDNSGVATVDIDGKVKAIASGNATITVTTNDGNKTASCVVTVFEPKGQGDPVDGHDWVQLWEDGPKFATENYTTKTNQEKEKHPNNLDWKGWAVPTKAQMQGLIDNLGGETPVVTYEIKDGAVTFTGTGDYEGNSVTFQLGQFWTSDNSGKNTNYVLELSEEGGTLTATVSSSVNINSGYCYARLVVSEE